MIDQNSTKPTTRTTMSPVVRTAVTTVVAPCGDALTGA